MSGIEQEPTTGVSSGSAEARAGSGMDSWTKRLVIASGVLVVGVLMVTAGIVFYVTHATTVPRTAVERDFMVSKQAAKANPQDPTSWAAYASASIAAGKLDDANLAIASLQGISKSAMVPMLKGDLATARGDLSAARKDYEQAASMAKAQHDAGILAGSAKLKGDPEKVRPSETEIQAYVSLGNLDLQVKDYTGAITHYQKALSLDPTAADVLVSLGNAQLAKGLNKDAVVSFKSALRYIPGYGLALDGLKRAQGGR